jgi:hypothetical protein
MTQQTVANGPTATSKNPEVGSTIQADGVTTNYLDAGKGAPFLLIHGSGPNAT